VDFLVGYENDKQNVNEEKSQNFMIDLAFILVLTFCALEFLECGRSEKLIFIKMRNRM
jgi:hypothetical protein